MRVFATPLSVPVRLRRSVLPLSTLLLGCCLAGCIQQPNRRMGVGTPLEVNKGFCFVHTSYEQDGEKLNWDDTVKKLGRRRESAPYVSAGNSWALGSIAAAVVATPAMFVGSWAKRDLIDMDEDASTALLAGGVVVGIGGIVMCVVSDAEYARAGEAYNERLLGSGPKTADDRAFEVPEAEGGE
jgi:hypothetical protein